MGCEKLLNHAYVLESLVQKTGNDENLMWSLTGIHDVLHAKLVKPEELTNRAMTGKNAGGRGLIDLLLYKKEVCDYLIGRWSDENRIDVDTKALLRKFGVPHKAYRMQLGDAGALGKDLSFITALPDSGQQLVRLVEKLVFGIEYDHHLKHSVRT